MTSRRPHAPGGVWQAGARSSFRLVLGGTLVAGALVAAIWVVNRGPKNVGNLTAAPLSDADGRSLGPPDAPVKLDVWEDFQCPSCRTFSVRIKPLLIENYVKTRKARFTYHDMSFMGPESLGAGMSARCADRQGKFWPFHDLLFDNQAGANSGVFSRDRTKEFAATLGLNAKLFSTCLDDPEIQEAVEAETRQAYIKGIKETPTLLVNGVEAKPVNNWPAVSAAIETALKAASGAPAR